MLIYSYLNLFQIMIINIFGKNLTTLNNIILFTICKIIFSLIYKMLAIIK